MHIYIYIHTVHTCINIYIRYTYIHAAYLRNTRGIITMLWGYSLLCIYVLYNVTILLIHTHHTGIPFMNTYMHGDIHTHS